jgi:hypothetical protein
MRIMLRVIHREIQRTTAEQQLFVHLEKMRWTKPYRNFKTRARKTVVDHFLV